ncbi:MAG TPA: hypothetical protein VIN69_07165 [Candidatus Limnocylindria bacterium]|jgi:hypothetical protein
MIVRWLLGFACGVAALVISDVAFPLGIALLVAITLLRPRPVTAAGACVAWGGGFFLAIALADRRCIEFNRLPNASCTMGDSTLFLIAGSAVLTLGVALTVFAARSRRRSG